MKNPIIYPLICCATLLIVSCTSTVTPGKNVGSTATSAPPQLPENKCILDLTELPFTIWTKRPLHYGTTDEQRFFSENAKQEGVVTLASQVQYKVIRSGCGDRPALNNFVKVRYHLTLLDGNVIDSSYLRKETPRFVLGSVIPGWQEAVSLMQVGAIWEIYVPSHMAYGSAGMGPVPKNSALIFTVELIDFN